MVSTPDATTAQVWAILATIPDPEIPTITVTDLGVIEGVELSDDEIRVEILPTFSGCPALDWMKDAVRDALEPLGLKVEVTVNRRIAWHSDRITEAGREKLRASGFAPPPKLFGGLMQLEVNMPDHLRALRFELDDGLECPHCASHETVLDSIFGPTSCRAIYHCRTCRQPFEQFKPI